MLKLLPVFCTIYLFLYFIQLGRSAHRRVFYGTPQTAFKYPHGSVVTLRKSPDWDAFCSGVIIGSRKVLTAAHCFQNAQGTIYLVGYGSSRIHEQNISHVEDIFFCGLIDVAVLTLASTLTESSRMKFFSMNTWNLDKAMNRLTLQTFMCGFGMWEGTNSWSPQNTYTDVVRCHSYHFTMNQLTAEQQFLQNHRFPIPPLGNGLYTYDDRYLQSISRDPASFEAYFAFYSTGCLGDSGAPVFYEAGHNDYRLMGIHVAGPDTCGNAFCFFKYDTAVHMNAIKDVCFNNDPNSPHIRDELI